MENDTATLTGKREMTVAELLEQWEREDFEDCVPPWHRINLWRRRAYWARDYVFRF